MIFDFVAVATDDKGSVSFLIAGQVGMGFEFLRVLTIGRAGLQPALHLLGNNLRLPLSRCCRRHRPIDFGIITSNRFVQLTSSEKGCLGKEPLTQRIDSAISQTSGLSAQSVTGTEIRVTGLDENSFCTLHIGIIPQIPCQTNSNLHHIVSTISNITSYLLLLIGEKR